MKTIHTEPKPVRMIYFWIGIIATLSYRTIIVFNFLEPIWVKVAWYVGTIGFVFYFWSRYRVVKQFSSLIKEEKLIDAVGEASNISGDQKRALSHIIETLATTKAQLNYEIIFALSAIALITGIILDLGLF